MSDETPAVSESELHAYVDGLLRPERVAAVEAFLASDPKTAAMVEDWRRQADDIRSLYAGYARRSTADGALLRAGAERRDARAAFLPRITMGMAGRTAAGIAILAFGIAIGQLMPPLWQTPSGTPRIASLPAEARTAFLVYASDIRHPVEVAAGERDHLAAWLSKRLDHSLTIPDLDGLGFSLVGGRLVPVAGRPGALLMYQNSTGQRLTVMVGRNDQNRETSFRYASDGGVETFYWIDGPVGYAVTGEISRASLQAIADECYRQLPG